MTSHQDGIESDENIATEATVSRKDCTTFLNFQNVDQKSKMSIGISEDTITVSRFGDEIYTMVLQKNTNTNFEINSKLGIISATIFTHDICSKITDTRIDLVLSYSLKFQHMQSTLNKLTIKCIIH